MATRESDSGAIGAPAGRDPHRLLGFRLPLLANSWSAIVTRRFARLFDLKQLEARILFVLGVNGPVSLKSLGQRAGVEKAYASRTTASLIEQSLIAKTVDPDDRRAVRLQLTERGQVLFGAILAEINSRDEEWIGVLNASEQRNLHSYLDRLDRRLGEIAANDRATRK